MKEKWIDIGTTAVPRLLTKQCIGSLLDMMDWEGYRLRWIFHLDTVPGLESNWDENMRQAEELANRFDDAVLFGSRSNQTYGGSCHRVFLETTHDVLWVEDDWRWTKHFRLRDVEDTCVDTFYFKNPPIKVGSTTPAYWRRYVVDFLLKYFPEPTRSATEMMFKQVLHRRGGFVSNRKQGAVPTEPMVDVGRSCQYGGRWARMMTPENIMADAAKSALPRAGTGSIDKHRFVFVGGLHKSGTTLLQTCLNDHPEMSGMIGPTTRRSEGQFLQDVYLPAARHGGPGQFGFDPKAHLTEDSSLCSEERRQQLFSQWSVHWDLTKTLLLEKSPPNLIRSRFLQWMFADSTFVFIVRHPIAVSLATNNWTHGSLSLPTLFDHWLACHELLSQDRERIRRHLVIHYEDLVAQPEATLAKVFTALEVAPTPTLQSVKPDVNATYFRQWEQLPSDLRQEIAAKFEVRVRRFGYSLIDPEYSGPNEFDSGASEAPRQPNSPSSQSSVAVVMPPLTADMSVLTAVIKTFERPQALERLIVSIRRYFPSLHIIVADDSFDPHPRSDVDYIQLPADVGASRGRNELVSRAETPYVLVLDDDLEFTAQTRIDLLLKTVQSASDVKLAGGNLFRANTNDRRWTHKLLKIQDTTLHMTPGHSAEREGYVLCDMVPDFFVAETETIRQIAWDEELKIGGEHVDFFLRLKQAGVKVAAVPKVTARHWTDRPKGYREWRKRGKTFWNLAMKKHGINKVICAGGRVIHAKDVPSQNSTFKSPRQVIIGIGSGRCGTVSLATLLSAQRGVSVSHELGPILPWMPDDSFSAARRLKRIACFHAEQSIVGDVASFYLNHIPALVQTDPSIRIVCLQRRKEEVVQSFSRKLTKQHIIRNHFTSHPFGKELHNVWSIAFPKYGAVSLHDGLSRYYDDYYRIASEFALAFPNNLQILDTEKLNSQEGVREILDWSGIPSAQQVVKVGIRRNSNSRGHAIA